MSFRVAHSAICHANMARGRPSVCVYPTSILPRSDFLAPSCILRLLDSLFTAGLDSHFFLFNQPELSFDLQGGGSAAHSTIVTRHSSLVARVYFRRTTMSDSERGVLCDNPTSLCFPRVRRYCMAIYSCQCPAALYTITVSVPLSARSQGKGRKYQETSPIDKRGQSRSTRAGAIL
ncbi:hypothetical protein BC826DRAFT_289557 [Russula brevipes]|nr:hypothetical protein BC826DRAFT_289557 [Russula brevipes]